MDSDLAKLYQVETKRLNEAVKRNIARFPEEFRFQLTEEETESLRSQFATLDESEGRGKHRKYLPHVFTEQGIAMLSAVLRSDVAIQTSIRIMNSFVEMRRFISNNALLFERISNVELKQLEYQKQTDEKLEQIFEYISEHEETNQKVFFDGQIYDAFSLIASLIQKAEKEITLIDGYVDVGTLNLLAKKNEGVSVTVYTHHA
ncbi:ORF6N domain-containing protein [[Clostridium] innocuum]|uniref:ORF6N domain-containing protein n=1 Tax=Clostridium innocuum TaxID=1522 RepID=UPI000D7AE31D|nr:ORF6N domain-containing protein [[Clostridium] innocuum]PWJ12830.1 ORF6N domain-containing protein [[Clostridium] innocuum]SSA47222.1 ORF6N domain-containing protein [[Clostridium] innocuum]